MDIQSLRNRKAKSFEKITKGIENEGVKNYDDPRFWKIERDKGGNATALIRFLDVTPECADDLPWVREWSHSFKVNGRWYIEKSLTTIGKDDPVSELNSRLWNESKDDNSPGRKQARNQKRKLVYISNILVINDPRNPDNNGKVFLFKYGKKIYDKIASKLSPEFEDDQALNVFDYWEGANFKLRVKTIKMKSFDGKDVEFPNYDDSAFENPSPVADNDEAILAIAQNQHCLKDLIAEKEFKTYEDLAKRLRFVLEGPRKAEDDAQEPSGEEEAGGAEEPAPAPQKPARAPRAAAKAAPKPAPAPSGPDGEDGEDGAEAAGVAYLRNLMKEDI